MVTLLTSFLPVLSSGPQTAREPGFLLSCRRPVLSVPDIWEPGVSWCLRWAVAGPSVPAAFLNSGAAQTGGNKVPTRRLQSRCCSDPQGVGPGACALVKLGGGCAVECYAVAAPHAGPVPAPEPESRSLKIKGTAWPSWSRDGAIPAWRPPSSPRRGHCRPKARASKWHGEPSAADAAVISWLRGAMETQEPHGLPRPAFAGGTAASGVQQPLRSAASALSPCLWEVLSLVLCDCSVGQVNFSLRRRENPTEPCAAPHCDNVSG